MARQTLSCCLIVKNEEKNILSCLSNIDILADEIVIVDTGSTDDTTKAIEYWVKKKNAQKNVKLIKVGKRFQDESGDFDFGAAKTFSFKNATKDYVMWLDATDIVTEQKKVKKQFIKETSKNSDVYFVLPTALAKSFAFNRTRIGKREHSRMDGKIHETMIIDNKNKKRIFIPVVIKTHKKKRKRDLNRNLRILKKEWEVKKTARICFYIASTYKGKNDLNNALKWFRTRVYDIEFKDNKGEEYYKSLEFLAELTLIMKKSDNINISDLYDIATEMIEKEPKRVEGHYYLARYYMKIREWGKALKKLTAYKDCKKPKIYTLWLNSKIYNGKALIKAIEECKTSIKYQEVIQPEQILDYGGRKKRSTYKLGNTQY